MNREKLIEDAAKANFEHYRAQRPADHGPYQSWEELDEDYREYLRGGARAALAVFEDAYAPADDEREALTKFLGVTAIRAEDRKPGQTRAEWYADAVLAAAGFRRTEQGEPTPVQVAARRGGKTQAMIESLLAQANERGIRVEVIYPQGEPFAARVAPLGFAVTRGMVQEVWDTFVKPSQSDDAPPQSAEMRVLMAILRGAYQALPAEENEIAPNRTDGSER